MICLWNNDPQLYSIEIESDKLCFVNAYFRHYLHNGTHKNVIITKKECFLIMRNTYDNCTVFEYLQYLL